MKKLIYIMAVIFLTATSLFAQNEEDALRYSQIYYGGTARALSMGGAFGALGGDFTSLSINPAGLGVNRHSELTFTPSLFSNRASSSFMGNETSDGKMNLNIGNLGLIGAYTSGSEEGWVSVNFGVGYNRLNDFNNAIVIEGVNNESSMIDFFQESANGKDFSSLNYFYEGLAWETFLIDSIYGDNTHYASVLQMYNDTFAPSYGMTQKKSIITSGTMGEVVFALGANYSNKLYIGATLGIQSIKYKENYTYSETDPNDDIYDFNSFEFNKAESTRGTGFNLKLGAIYRPIEWMRVGAAVHTPTFYDLNYKYNSDIAADYDNGDSYSSESMNGEFDYQLTSPFRAIGSMGFIFKKMALFSIDYEYVDYSQMQLSGANAGEFSDENSSIHTNYVATSNVRAGVEYRYGPFSLRGGVAYFGSPYGSSTGNTSSERIAYSGGFGIKDNNIFFDLGYVYMSGKENYYLYSPDVVSIQPASLNRTSGQILATFGVKF